MVFSWFNTGFIDALIVVRLFVDVTISVVHFSALISNLIIYS